jgi:ABC-type xylose transport system substrate-binding protein
LPKAKSNVKSVEKSYARQLSSFIKKVRQGRRVLVIGKQDAMQLFLRKSNMHSLDVHVVS